MIYIVSGYMRTGTSMMVRCLSNSGLSPIVNAEREKLNEQHGDAYYKPNKFGFFEPSIKDIMNIRKYDGKLLKVLMGGAIRLPVHEYKIIFMLRDIREIAASYEAFFGDQLPRSVTQNFTKMTDYFIDMLRNRKDSELIVLNYRDVVKAPKRAFDLVAKSWPIDAKKASTFVDSSLCRFRMEKLEAA